MPSFRYTALDEQQRSATGEIAAATVREAIERLEAQGFEVLSIGQLDAVAAQVQQSTSNNDYSLRHAFDELFSHRQTLAPALAAYTTELPTGHLRGEVEQVVNLLNAGNVDAAVRSFGVLADHWTPLLSAAAVHSESQPIVAEYLRRSAEPLENRPFRWSPFVYPLMLLALSAAIVVAMSLMVIPTFRDIFEEFDLELPDATMLVLAVAESIGSGRIYYGVLILVLILLGGWVLLRQLPSKLRTAVSRWTLWRRRRVYLNGRLATYVADLLQAGLSRCESLSQAATAIHHPAVAASTTDLAERLQATGSKAKHSSRSSLTHTVEHAVSAEMQSDARIHLLRELGQDYGDQTRRYLPWKQQLLLGPITLVVVGFTVGFTVLALFLPLVRLIEGLS